MAIERRKGKKGTTYRIRVFQGRDSKGHQRFHTETFRGSLKQAKRREAELLKRDEAGTLTPSSGRASLGDMLEAWLAQKQPHLRTQVANTYGRILRRHVIERIGAMKVSQVRPHHIEKMYADIRAMPNQRGGTISAATILMIHGRLVEAWRWAVKTGMADFTPMDNVGSPRLQRQDINVPQLEDVVNVMNLLAQRSPWAVKPVALSLATGARRAEILGLQWQDVYLGDDGRGTPYVSIRRSLTHMHRRFYLDAPKTRRSSRRITLSRIAVSCLRSRRAEAEEAAEVVGVGTGDEDFVFAHADGTPYIPNSLSNAYREACKRVGVKASRIHALRHLFATSLLKANVHPKLVQELLGHSSIAMTLDTYSHLVPAMLDATREPLDQMLEYGGEKGGFETLVTQNVTQKSTLAEPEGAGEADSEAKNGAVEKGGQGRML